MNYSEEATESDVDGIENFKNPKLHSKTPDKIEGSTFTEGSSIKDDPPINKVHRISNGISLRLDDERMNGVSRK